MKLIFKCFFPILVFLLFFQYSRKDNVFAACSGTVVCCQDYVRVYEPAGCTLDCVPSQYNTCVPCTSYDLQCAPGAQVSSSCQQIAGSCASGISCDQGQLSGSCTTTATNCGNGTCGAGESCSNCVADCGICPPSTQCGDGACNGSETTTSCPGDCVAGESCGNGSCNTAAGENCNNCTADCGACTGCGDNVCNAGETCSTCAPDCGVCSDPDFCGDGQCNGSETCSNCNTDCGSCSNPFCGDDFCTGSESCNSCPGDCGACSAGPSDAWWQVTNGSIFAESSGGTAIYSNVPYETCGGSNCTPYLIKRGSGNGSSGVGIAVTGGGLINARNHLTEGGTPLAVVGTRNNRINENFDYFYRRYSIGDNPTDDFVAGSTIDPANATKPTYNANKKYYYHQGNMTIQQLWDVAANESYVVFIDGNLTFTDTNNIDRLTRVAEGGFLAFIVSGNITINHDLRRNNGNNNSNLEGVFIADGQIITLSVPSGNDRRFNGQGVFVAWSGFSLQRDLGNNNNEDVPAENFTYRPDFIKNTPQTMKRSQIIWQERN